MPDNSSIKVDYNFIEKILTLADLDILEKIELKDLDNALDIIKNKLDKVNRQTNERPLHNSLFCLNILNFIAI